MVRTWHFHCWGPGFYPWSGNYDAASLAVPPKINNIKNRGNIFFESFKCSYLAALSLSCSMWDIVP